MGTHIIEKVIVLPDENNLTIEVNEVGSEDVIIVYENDKVIGYVHFYFYTSERDSYWELNSIYDRVSDESLGCLINIYPDYTFKVLTNEKV